MVLGTATKKLNVLILTDSFLIRGDLTVPTNMRFSDALNKFLKEQQFLAITNAEISFVTGDKNIEKKEFLLINKDRVVGIAPNE
jgi:hypothetical protein